jgi:hypothetical protein
MAVSGVRSSLTAPDFPFLIQKDVLYQEIEAPSVVYRGGKHGPSYDQTKQTQKWYVLPYQTGPC